ncbi:hypothetical protein Csa_001446 [Cucumis sativus]|uniref:Uncharacterized protein n=1 Tax=Cucumis sativus TaxID=3659 RepID=A0A0A0LK98_CUCSA|nr:hypothetical protein Csa_001446 [Cucumis sativus]
MWWGLERISIYVAHGVRCGGFEPWGNQPCGFSWRCGVSMPLLIKAMVSPLWLTPPPVVLFLSHKDD